MHLVIFIVFSEISDFLDRFANNIDLSSADPVVHKHTPYIVILIKVAEKWAQAYGGCLPSTRQEKRISRSSKFEFSSICSKVLIL